MAEMQVAMVGVQGNGLLSAAPGVVAAESADFFKALIAQMEAGQAVDPATLSAQPGLPAEVAATAKKKPLQTEAGDAPQTAPGLDPMLWLAGLPMAMQLQSAPAQSVSSTVTDASLPIDAPLAGAVPAAVASTLPKEVHPAMAGLTPATPEGTKLTRPFGQSEQQPEIPPAKLADKGQELPAVVVDRAALKRDISEVVGENDAQMTAPVPAAVDALGANEALRSLVAQRPGETLARTADVGVRATVDVPLRSSAFVAEFGDRLVWAVSRHAQVAEISLTPPHLGSVEVRLSMSGNEAGAQFYSPHANVREILEQAMPRLKEIMAEAGIQLGQAQVNDQAFARREPSTNQGSSVHSGRDEGGVGSNSGAEPVPIIRSGLGLVDLYA